MHGPQDRAAIELVDIIVTFFVIVALLVLSPFFYRFIDMVTAEADPFSSLLLQLVVPILFIAVIVSVGISARGTR